MSHNPTISAQVLAELDGQGEVEIIDVRTPIEFREVRAAKAKNIPLDILEPHAVMKLRNCAADEPIYVICKGGTRGAKAQQKFIDAGFTSVINVEGGTEAWVKAGLPVVRGKKAVSLERQVRITAGFLVLIGALLGIFVHPYYAAISAFVGAGLVFAGITNSCVMGMMLAKMPWNQCKDGACSV
ncbi:rhodanese-like domain-containing protein [Aureliella helgolandensis]|uniref:Inner membrane protein YgaP n=1 Tax=Aureliella helgolandensis TaxID=2527968 RepID=A0A518GD03_9BACT|nr:rhodanese-like domain-containing protein [Aureliella helgolandensis]QDV26476.1 Inner membrane protein YgaP [Aureliella helgolandensis]